jgi:ubiquinone/menaquinone biosynthesis C-methylase UbiE
MRFSQKALAENHARLIERNADYRQSGYDINKNTKFILSKALPLKGRVLEIGTGKGRFLVALLRHVPLITTIDVDPDGQRFARMNVAYEKPSGKARFVIADARRLPWCDGAFDAVVSMNAFHHMRQMPLVIGEILRVVRPNGKVVLADFNQRGFSIFDRIHRREQRIHERRKYDFTDVVKLFDARHWFILRCNCDCQEVLIASQKTWKRPDGKRLALRPKVVSNCHRDCC